MNIALCGFMGAGKTSVGRELSKSQAESLLIPTNLSKRLKGKPSAVFLPKKARIISVTLNTKPV